MLQTKLIVNLLRVLKTAHDFFTFHYVNLPPKNVKKRNFTPSELTELRPIEVEGHINQNL